jgi:hypothetical protein
VEPPSSTTTQKETIHEEASPIKLMRQKIGNDYSGFEITETDSLLGQSDKWSIGDLYLLSKKDRRREKSGREIFQILFNKLDYPKDKVIIE